MTYAFIYPCDPFNPKKVDPAFEEEFNLIKASHPTYLIDTDNLGVKALPLQTEEICVYRGWMLVEDKYRQLEIKAQGQLLTSTQEYLDSHHLPNWYEAVKDFTASSVITNPAQAEQDFKATGWSQAFIKDYVKSLKTGTGSVIDLSGLSEAITNMRKYRGFIEGGIVLREVKQLKPETETRFFVANGTLHIPNDRVALAQIGLAEKIKLSFPDKKFYSIDIAQDEEGKNWLVEIGDGQVSDFVGWELPKFVKVLEALTLSPQFTSHLKPKR